MMKSKHYESMLTSKEIFCYPTNGFPESGVCVKIEDGPEKGLGIIIALADARALAADLVAAAEEIDPQDWEPEPDAMRLIQDLDERLTSIEIKYTPRQEFDAAVANGDETAEAFDKRIRNLSDRLKMVEVSSDDHGQRLHGLEEKAKEPVYGGIALFLNRAIEHMDDATNENTNDIFRNFNTRRAVEDLIEVVKLLVQP